MHHTDHYIEAHAFNKVKKVKSDLKQAQQLWQGGWVAEFTYSDFDNVTLTL